MTGQGPANQASRLVLVALVVVATASHLVCLERFGWFRDELYYLACGEHLALGYVDHPPLVAWTAALVTGVFGRSFLAIRALPILLGASSIALTWRLAERLGARAGGRVLAAVGAWLVPTYLFLFHHLSMNSIEVVLWTAAALLVLDLDEGAPMRRWVAFGAAVGLGLLNKHTMAFWTVALVAGWLLTAQRRLFAKRGPWVAALVAAIVVAPHLWWQHASGWPTIEFYRNAAAHKIQPMSALAFLTAQLTLVGPGNAPLWLAGLVFLLRAPSATRVRALGIAYLVLVALLVAMGGKPYYLAPFYPVLLAAGGAALETWTAHVRPGVRVATMTGLLGLELAAGLVIAPLALPILDVDATIAWSKRLGVAPPKTERGDLGELPQHFADMLGWNELVGTLERVHAALPVSERADAELLVQNYGQAAAVDWLGRPRGLPRARSPHNAYFTWGPPERADAPVILIGAAGSRASDFEHLFSEVRLVARTSCERCMPKERNLAVYVCRGWKQDPRQIWPGMKRYF